jgi:hypothetical protein
MAAEQEEVRCCVGSQHGNTGICGCNSVATRLPAANARSDRLSSLSCWQEGCSWGMASSICFCLCPCAASSVRPTHPPTTLWSTCCSWRGRPPMRLSGRPPARCAASSRT